MTETHAPQKLMRGGGVEMPYVLILTKLVPPLVAGRGPNLKPRKEHPEPERATWRVLATAYVVSSTPDRGRSQEREIGARERDEGALQENKQQAGEYV